MRRLLAALVLAGVCASSLRAAPDPCAGPEGQVDALVSGPFASASSAIASDDVVMSYACRALASRRRAPCDSLHNILGKADRPQPWTPSRLCLDTWRDVSRTRIVEEAAKPGIHQECVEFLRINPDDEYMRFNDDDKACDIIFAHVYEPDVRCRLLAKISREPLSDKQIEEAVLDEKEMLGNIPESKCLALREPRRERCLSAVRFRQAFRKKDPVLCGGLPLCLALLTGDESVCLPYARRIRAAVCAGGMKSKP